MSQMRSLQFGRVRATWVDILTKRSVYNKICVYFVCIYIYIYVYV